MREIEKYEAAAHELGIEHARNAASWVIDGNTSQEHVARMVAMLDDGDPEAFDYLPRYPDLSGEYADDLTPAKLATDVLNAPIPDDEMEWAEIQDALADAYEAGVSETFQVECERVLRAALVTS